MYVFAGMSPARSFEEKLMYDAQDANNATGEGEIPPSKRDTVPDHGASAAVAAATARADGFDPESGDRKAVPPTS